LNEDSLVAVVIFNQKSTSNKVSAWLAFALKAPVLHFFVLMLLSINSSAFTAQACIPPQWNASIMLRTAQFGIKRASPLG
jgi:hypothetical protein